MLRAFILAFIFAIANSQPTCVTGPSSACVAGTLSDFPEEDDVYLLQARVQMTEKAHRILGEEPLPSHSHHGDDGVPDSKPGAKVLWDAASLLWDAASISPANKLGVTGSSESKHDQQEMLFEKGENKKASRGHDNEKESGDDNKQKEQEDKDINLIKGDLHKTKEEAKEEAQEEQKEKEKEKDEPKEKSKEKPKEESKEESKEKEKEESKEESKEEPKEKEKEKEKEEPKEEPKEESKEEPKEEPKEEEKEKDVEAAEDEVAAAEDEVAAAEAKVAAAKDKVAEAEAKEKKAKKEEKAKAAAKAAVKAGAKAAKQSKTKKAENDEAATKAPETTTSTTEAVEPKLPDYVTDGQPDPPAHPKVPPPSPTLQCVLNLTMQYFIVFTLLQVLRTINQFNGQRLLGWQKIIETGCTTVTYAPSLCCLFLCTRMRAIQLTQGQTEKYELPQPWVQTAMYYCTYSVLAQVILVLLLPIFTGEARVATDADGNLDTSALSGGGVVVLVLSLCRYVVMLCLYGGFATICYGIHMMEAPIEIWGDAAPPVSPAVACTINLTTQFFCIYLLVALAKTAVEVNGPSLFLTKLQGLLSFAKYTQNFVPMLCILFIGARMRALQMDPKNGSPQWWAQYCFYGCTYSVLIQTVLLIVLPFVTKCECKQGFVEADSIFIMEDKFLSLVMTLIRYAVMLGLYGGFTAVCVSVYTIEHPQDVNLTPPISPAMQCVMNLTVQYFGVYLILFILISLKQFAQINSSLIDALIYTFEGAQKTVMFAPMLAILFIGCRMRALQLLMADDEKGKIPLGAGPQTWAQDAMFLATWSLHVQLIMTILVPLITGAGHPEMDESGNVKAPVGTTKFIGIIIDALRYLCLISMYGGAVSIMVAIYYMTPETLPPNDEGQLIPGVDVPQPPSAPTPGTTTAAPAAPAPAPLSVSF